MNSQAANAALAGRLSLRAGLAPGDRTTVYGSSPPASPFESVRSFGLFMSPPLRYEDGHLLRTGAVAPV